MTNEEEQNQQPASGAAQDKGAGGGEELTAALETTLEGLNRSIAKMEEIVRSIEEGDPDWEESIKLLSEANELAESSSRKLDQVVQDVVYGESAAEDSAEAQVVTDAEEEGE